MIDYIILLWLGAITGFLIVQSMPTIKIARKDRPPKPPKPYTCPHGKISTLAVYTIKGQKKTLCKYCYNKEENKEVEENGMVELPRL